MIQDRTGNTLLKLTQEFLAEMIGSRRTTVSEVADGLQDRGLIEYARGSIKLADRIGLENASCECYPITRKLLANIYMQTSTNSPVKLYLRISLDNPCVLGRLATIRIGAV
jgi:hypothetical protein